MIKPCQIISINDESKSKIKINTKNKNIVLKFDSNQAASDWLFFIKEAQKVHKEVC